MTLQAVLSVNKTNPETRNLNRPNHHTQHEVTGPSSSQSSEPSSEPTGSSMMHEAIQLAVIGSDTELTAPRPPLEDGAAGGPELP